VHKLRTYQKSFDSLLLPELASAGKEFNLDEILLHEGYQLK